MDILSADSDALSAEALSTSRLMRLLYILPVEVYTQNDWIDLWNQSQLDAESEFGLEEPEYNVSIAVAVGDATTTTTS